MAVGSGCFVGSWAKTGAAMNNKKNAYFIGLSFTISIESYGSSIVLLISYAI